MSIYPQLGSGSPGSIQGISEVLADLRRQVAALNANKTYIGSQAIIGSNIATGSIVTSHISSGSVITDHLTAGTITSEMIQTLAINAGHMQANSITATNAALQNLVVTTAKINDLAVMEGKIGNLQVTNAKIGLLAVQTANIDNLAVTTAKIQDAAIKTAKIDDAQITTAKIGDAQVTNLKVANIDGDKINANTLNADRLFATAATADTLLSRLIHASGIVATTGLSAVSAKIGNLVIDTTFGGSILVGTAGGARIVTDNTGITGYSDATNVTFKLDRSTGKVITLAGLGGPNSVLNSGFEDPTNAAANWSGYDATFAGSTVARFGTKSLVVTKQSANNNVVLLYQDGSPRRGVTPGAKVTTSAYIKRGGNWSNVRMGVRWHTAPTGGGTFHSEDYAPVGVSEGGMAEWTRVSYTFTVPAGVYGCGPSILWDRTAYPSFGQGGWCYVDGVQVEEGDLLTAYAPKPDEILPNAVTGVELAPNSVSGNVAGAPEAHIIPGTIIATDLYVTSLSAITANMGTLNAGRIEGGSIAGAVIDAGSITTSKISVGGQSRSLAINGAFEDSHPTLSQFAASWSRNAYGGGAGAGNLYVQAAGGGPGGARSGTKEAVLYGGAGASSGALDNDTVPATEGEVWTLSFWAYQTGPSSPGFYARLRGGPLQNDTNEANSVGSVLENVALSGTWTKYHAKFVIPAGWRWAGARFLQWTSNTGSYIIVDDVELHKALAGTQITDGAITTGLIAADAVTAEKFNAFVGGSNRLEDPTFQAPLGTTWTADAGSWTLGSSADWPGGGRGAWTASSGNPYIRSEMFSVTPNQKYTASCWQYVTAAITESRLFIWWYDVADAFISQSTYNQVPNSSWAESARMVATFTAPSNAIRARMGLQFMGHGGSTNHYVSGPQVEQGEIATAFSYSGFNGVFTGGTFRTAPGGQRVEINKDGLFKYASDGVTTSVRLGPTDGLDLRASTALSPPNDRRLRWFDSTYVPGEIFTTYNTTGGGQESEIKVISRQTTPGTGTNAVILEAQNSSSVMKADLKVYYAPGTGDGWIQVAAGSNFATLLNSSNESTYLKNANGTDDRVFNGGSTSITGNGAVTRSITINHDLGRTPASAVATASTGGLNVAVTSVTSTQMTLEARQTDNAVWSSTHTLYWMVLGT